ncbi:hypothetical protein [Frankia sp. CcI49]|uniref:hypothetical protein n=1 Tax=Frankia sp. CcI49 TaxID=1745382 RepID=UPI00105510F2|nr:hypothetical protein [Frankia sp. CcI49]
MPDLDIAAVGVQAGLVAVLRLGSDPDSGGPEEVVEDMLDRAAELGDAGEVERGGALWDAATQVLAALDDLGPLDRARVLNEAADRDDERHYCRAGWPCGG